MTDTIIKDLPSLKKNRRALEADLTAVFAKYGLTFDSTSAKIGMGKCEFKVSTKTGSADDQLAIAKREYEVYAGMLGLPKDGFGASYNIGGEVYRIIGVQPSKPKNCVKLVRVRDGNTNFQCSVDHIRHSRKVA